MIKDIEKRTAKLAEPICAELGLKLWNVDYVREGGNYFLRVHIERDHKEPITINDCEAVSRPLDKKLDEEDFISQAYTLEVCSAGIDRPLKKPEDFTKYVGELVDIKLYKPIDKGSKNKQYQGRLEGLIDKSIVIITEDNTRHNFPKDIVASCRLAVVF